MCACVSAFLSVCDSITPPPLHGSRRNQRERVRFHPEHVLGYRGRRSPPPRGRPEGEPVPHQSWAQETSTISETVRPGATLMKRKVVRNGRFGGTGSWSRGRGGDPGGVAGQGVASTPGSVTQKPWVLERRLWSVNMSRGMGHGARSWFRGQGGGPVGVAGQKHNFAPRQL